MQGLDTPIMVFKQLLSLRITVVGLHCRAGKGSRAQPSKQPAEPLVLWGYELSPFVVVVKETLSELELPYKQVSCL